MNPQIVQRIADRLQARDKRFVSRNEFFKVIGAALARSLGVSPSDSVTALSVALQSHCGDAFRVVQGGRTLYVALNLPDEDFLLDKARRLTTFTPAQLALNLPMPKARVAPALTRLLESGQILCIGLKADFTPILRFSGSGKPSNSVAVVTSQVLDDQSALSQLSDDETALHRAFLEIGQGRNFVAIHRLRAHLGWERQRFDQTLLRLQSAERILLNMGDPTRLTRTELEGAYLDRNGMRYLTLNWLESRP
ncbi:hypothetical protein SIID45300_02237 [Candidatus Magnetaquicoccaceae bacterium FCR-1]|uniref:Uncharacterized protein n=1 Tax=Candidatus Magnetaquiglobus chichijimensis TaxID=3141448 RepID=A0ABQ0CAJ0_9PROT